jgi:hypothetical protein
MKLLDEAHSTPSIFLLITCICHLLAQFAALHTRTDTEMNCKFLESFPGIFVVYAADVVVESDRPGDSWAQQ